MSKKVSNTKQNVEIEIVDLFLLLWKNKILFLIIAFLALILGYLYCYLNPIQEEGRYYSITNLLIEDFVEDKDIYSKTSITGMINKNLSSSYNYEKWSNENKELSKYLSQEKATHIS